MEEVIVKKIGTRDVTFGKNVMIIEPVNLYECSIGDNSFIGPFVEIQKNVNIGKNTRIQSHTFDSELVVIGAGSVVTKDITEPGIHAGNPAKKIRAIGSK